MVGSLIKFNKEVEPSVAERHTIAQAIETKKMYLKKGLKCTNARVKEGYNSDDFVYNRFTVALYFDAIKIPRFLARSILRKMK